MLRFFFAMFILWSGPNDNRPDDQQLRYNYVLSAYAQTYADEMCATGVLEHATSARRAAETHDDWKKVGENVGRGYVRRPRALNRAFVESPKHYAVMTDPDYDIFGFGACIRGNNIFVVYRFEDRERFN